MDTSQPAASSFDANQTEIPIPTNLDIPGQAEVHTAAAAAADATDIDMLNPNMSMNMSMQTLPDESLPLTAIINNVAAVSGGGAEAEIASLEASLKTTRKDKNLKEFLQGMDEFAPIIPDAVTDYYLSLSGFATSDPRIKRLLALATQKFIADIAADAYQYSRIRTSSSNAGGGGTFVPGGAQPAGGVGGMAGMGAVAGAAGGRRGGRVVLTMEDLGGAVAEYGVNTRRPEFYR